MDDLRDRLKAIDPMPPGVTTEPVTMTSSTQRLEHIMSTGTTEQRPESDPRTRRRWQAGLAVATATIVAMAAIAVFTGGDEPDPVTAPPLELSLGQGDGMASCLAFDVAILADMELAFEGTATSVDREVVTLTVDRWFTGGEAAEVSLVAPAGLEALIGGIDFTVGTQYLITAANGVVNYCGYSGEATPELRAAFEEAFAG